MVPIIPVAIFAASFIPNVYYGLTRGDWGLGWDYALTGHDYVGELIDKVLPDDTTSEIPETGLTEGDYTYLADLFNSVSELTTIVIVVSVVLALVIFFRGKK